MTPDQLALQRGVLRMPPLLSDDERGKDPVRFHKIRYGVQQMKEKHGYNYPDGHRYRSPYNDLSNSFAMATSSIGMMIRSQKLSKTALALGIPVVLLELLLTYMHGQGPLARLCTALWQRITAVLRAAVYGDDTTAAPSPAVSSSSLEWEFESDPEDRLRQRRPNLDPSGRMSKTEEGTLIPDPEDVEWNNLFPPPTFTKPSFHPRKQTFTGNGAKLGRREANEELAVLRRELVHATHLLNASRREMRAMKTDHSEVLQQLMFELAEQTENAKIGNGPLLGEKSTPNGGSYGHSRRSGASTKCDIEPSSHFSVGEEGVQEYAASVDESDEDKGKHESYLAGKRADKGAAIEVEESNENAKDQGAVADGPCAETEASRACTPLIAAAEGDAEDETHGGTSASLNLEVPQAPAAIEGGSKEDDSETMLHKLNNELVQFLEHIDALEARPQPQSNDSGQQRSEAEEEAVRRSAADAAASGDERKAFDRMMQSVTSYVFTHKAREQQQQQQQQQQLDRTKSSGSSSSGSSTRSGKTPPAKQRARSPAASAVARTSSTEADNNSTQMSMLFLERIASEVSSADASAPHSEAFESEAFESESESGHGGQK